MSEFIFDVDGTLTPSRGTIDPEFKEFFMAFAKKNNVYLVTGSDRPKTIEQIGLDAYSLCKRVYNCSGNDVYEGDNNITHSKWLLPEPAHEWLTTQITESPWDILTGKHFEHRTGMCNFSVVGRNANTEQRKAYYEYDCKYEEREMIAETFNHIFPDLNADVGGETGIDIFPRGKNKAQILNHFIKDDIKFFGDRCEEGGNDHPIARELYPYQVHKVNSWRDTWRLLKPAGRLK